MSHECGFDAGHHGGTVVLQDGDRHQKEPRVLRRNLDRRRRICIPHDRRGLQSEHPRHRHVCKDRRRGRRAAVQARPEGGAGHEDRQAHLVPRLQDGARRHQDVLAAAEQVHRRAAAHHGRGDRSEAVRGRVHQHHAVAQESNDAAQPALWRRPIQGHAA